MRHRRHNTAERKPQPRQTRVTGVLDVIRHSTHSFSLKLEDRIEVRGVVKTREQIEELKKFLGKKLLVLGRAVYRTSGKLLRIDAEGFETGEGQPLLFAKVPQARATRPTPVRIEPSSRQRQGVPAFFGTWPGEETDEDFERMLAELRGSSVTQPLLAVSKKAQAGVPVPQRIPGMHLSFQGAVNRCKLIRLKKGLARGQAPPAGVVTGVPS